MTTLDKIIEIVAKQLKREPSEVTPDMDLAEAGYESLDVIETIFEIEETWDLNIDFNANSEDADKFKTPARIAATVDTMLAARVFK